MIFYIKINKVLLIILEVFVIFIKFFIDLIVKEKDMVILICEFFKLDIFCKWFKNDIEI